MKIYEIKRHQSTDLRIAFNLGRHKEHRNRIASLMESTDLDESIDLKEKNHRLQTLSIVDDVNTIEFYKGVRELLGLENMITIPFLSEEYIEIVEFDRKSNNDIVACVQQDEEGKYYIDIDEDVIVKEEE